MRAIIYPGRDFNRNIALVFLFACAPAPGAGLGDNPAFAVALGAGGGVGKAAKEALVDPSYLPCAIAVGTLEGLTTWFAANTLAH